MAEERRLLASARCTGRKVLRLHGTALICQAGIKHLHGAGDNFATKAVARAVSRHRHTAHADILSAMGACPSIHRASL